MRVAPSRKIVSAEVVIGIVGGLVIIAVVSAIFYLGTETNKDRYKEAWMTVKSRTNSMSFKERVTLQGNEVAIIRPGVMNMVIDYKQNTLAMQFDRALNGDESALCYMCEFRPGMFGREEDVERAIKPGVMEVKKEISLFFVMTGDKIPVDRLSPKARGMCFGATILTVRQVQTDDHDRQKRSNYSFIYKHLVTIPSTFETVTETIIIAE